MVKRNLRCGECGSRNITKQMVSDYSGPYMQFESITLREAIELPQCNECKNCIFVHSDLVRLDEAFRKQLREDGLLTEGDES